MLLLNLGQTQRPLPADAGVCVSCSFLPPTSAPYSTAPSDPSVSISEPWKHTEHISNWRGWKKYWIIVHYEWRYRQTTHQALISKTKQKKEGTGFFYLITNNGPATGWLSITWRLWHVCQLSAVCGDLEEIRSLNKGNHIELGKQLKQQSVVLKQSFTVKRKQ